MDAGCAPEQPARPSRSAPSRPWEPGTCSANELQGYAQSCFGAFASPTVCAAFRQQYAVCAACLDSTFDDPTWGALIWNTSHAFFFPNFGGCVAHLTGDTSDTGCGATANRLYDCRVQACARCPTDNLAELADAEACTSDNRIATYCAKEIASFNVACNVSQPELLPEACKQGTSESESDVAMRYIQMWCGPAGDGGTDASSPSDGGPG